MVTVRQFSSGVGRIARAAQRDAQRAHRQRLLQERADERAALLEASADAADGFAELVNALTGAHRVTFSKRDWMETAGAVPPDDPLYTDHREKAATVALEAYRPGWFARNLGFAEKARRKHRAAIDRGRQDDAAAHEAALADAGLRRQEIAVARDVVALKSKALLAALSEHVQWDGIPIEGVNLLAVDGRVIISVDAMELEDMPTKSVTLLQSGKASIKNLSPAKVLELHRDNICSSAVRVAIEVLGALPINAVEVVMQPDLLDCATGHIMQKPVLYLRTTAQALSAVNLQRAAPAPLAELLGARFDWSKRDGLRPIELTAFDLPPQFFSEPSE